MAVIWDGTAPKAMEARLPPPSSSLVRPREAADRAVLTFAATASLQMRREAQRQCLQD